MFSHARMWCVVDSTSTARLIELHGSFARLYKKTTVRFNATSRYNKTARIVEEQFVSLFADFIFQRNLWSPQAKLNKSGYTDTTSSWSFYFRGPFSRDPNSFRCVYRLFYGDEPYDEVVKPASVFDTDTFPDELVYDFLCSLSSKDKLLLWHVFSCSSFKTIYELTDDQADVLLRLLIAQPKLGSRIPDIIAAL